MKRIAEAGFVISFVRTDFDSVENVMEEVWRCETEDTTAAMLFRVTRARAEEPASRWEVVHAAAGKQIARGTALFALSARLLAPDGAEGHPRAERAAVHALRDEWVWAR